MSNRVAYALLLTLGAALACAAPPENPPLESSDPGRGYRFGELSLGEGNTQDTFVFLAISGGGLRSSALAYGVIQELEASKIGAQGRSLLDEVDVISSVSGGSLAAAYYVTFGREAFLEEFPEAVLSRNMQSAIFWRTMAPWSWPRMWFSRHYSRSDLMEEYLDEHVFLGRDFAKLPRVRPYLILNSMDLALGAPFSFTQDDFDRVCSDLDGVAMVRGVMASMALSPYYAPVLLHNYPKEHCGIRESNRGRSETENDPRRYREARIQAAYDNAEQRPVIHLVDGALVDPLALRPMERAVTSTDASFSVLRGVNRGTIDRVVVISVDASFTSSASESYPKDPSVWKNWTSAQSRAQEFYGTDVSELVRLQMSRWQESASDFDLFLDGMIDRCNGMAVAWCEDSSARDECERRAAQECYARFDAKDFRPPSAESYTIPVSTNTIPDLELRRRLDEIPKDLQLSEAEAQLLIDMGRKLLRESYEFQMLLEDLAAEQ